MEPTSHSCKTMLVLLCLLTWPNIADPHSYLDLYRSGIDDILNTCCIYGPEWVQDG
jgi:hypothetical protein